MVGLMPWTELFELSASCHLEPDENERPPSVMETTVHTLPAAMVYSV
jgi:hypothetical protein